MKKNRPMIWSARHSLVSAMAAMLLVVSQWAAAEQKPAGSALDKEGPEYVVQTVTDQLLSLAKDDTAELKKDPEAFYGKVESLLEPSVSFDFIAKNVMGPTYWEQANEKQQEQFVATFKRSLVETLVKGMASNVDLDIQLVSEQSQVLKNKASIVQKVSGPEGSNLVVYSLGKGKSGSWKVLNVVLDGVNLGKTFRSQFAQGVKDNKGDLQAAIEGWSAQTKG
ncbi:phospholipid-binding protein MlaC [Teredinibacter turnerae]|uniref:MlaC/ttg2D family ABC transporter substrate-binding protein n=1 Tax=Teredinibacter turnerae TaxID=2426 RepID=UPI00041681B5|nr:ABC transporter substrate-binding protein [Teredinibacter turnerae]